MIVGSGTLPTLGRTTNNALSPETIWSEKTLAFKPKLDSWFNSMCIFFSCAKCVPERLYCCPGNESKMHSLPLPFTSVVQKPIEENVPNPKLFIKTGGYHL